MLSIPLVFLLNQRGLLLLRQTIRGELHHSDFALSVSHGTAI